MLLAPSLHRLGTSSLVNSYLVEEAGQLTLIDAGLPGLWKDLVAELHALGRSPSDIRAVLLTHGDVDHVGFAERLRHDHGVPVWISDADAAEARGEVPKPKAATGPVRLVPMMQFLAYGVLRGGLRGAPVKEVRTFEAGASLDVPGSPRVIGLPGHTPGSVAFYMPGVDALFMGDAMTTRSVISGKVGPALGPFTVDNTQALASLAALSDLRPRWVLPGHGDAWSGGLPEALSLIRLSAAPSGSAHQMADGVATPERAGVPIVNASTLMSDNDIRALSLPHHRRLECPRSSASNFAAPFTTIGHTVGFDGTPADGANEIEAHLTEVFGSHMTATYIYNVREVRRLCHAAGMLRTVVGMVPPSGSDINAWANAVQTLVAAEYEKPRGGRVRASSMAR